MNRMKSLISNEAKKEKELVELGFKMENLSFLSSVLESRFWLREIELSKLSKLGFR